MTTVTTTPAPITEGAISSGTLRTHDLIRTFLTYLPTPARQDLINSGHGWGEDLRIVENWDEAKVEHPDYFESDDSLEFLDCLDEVLNDEAAKQNLHFSSHDDDGALFGFWANDNDEGDNDHLNDETSPLRDGFLNPQATPEQFAAAHDMFWNTSPINS